MVHRGGSRFGISSNHSVRYPQSINRHKGQHIIIEAKGSVPENMPLLDVELSLNKQGRWLLPDQLADRISGQRGTLIVSQHHWTGRSDSKKANCLSVQSKTNDLTFKKTSRHTYSHFDHLISDLDVMQAVSKEACTKKRNKQGRKQKGPFHNDREELMIHCKVYSKAHRKINLKENSSKNYRSSKSSKARKGFSGSLASFDNFYNDESFYEEEDSPCADAIAESLITSQTDMMVSGHDGPNHGIAKLAEFILEEKENLTPSLKQSSSPSQTMRKKLFYVDKKEFEVPHEMKEYRPCSCDGKDKEQKYEKEKKGKRKHPKNKTSYDCAIFATSVYPASITNFAVLCHFGDVSLHWGMSKPQRLGANISQYIEKKLISTGLHQESNSLKETGHEHWILIQRQPENIKGETTKRDNNRVMLQIKLMGIPADAELLALTTEKLRGNPVSTLDHSLSYIKEYIDNISLDRFFVKPRFSARMPHVALETVSHVLKWETMCVTPVSLIKKSQMMDKPCKIHQPIKEREFLDDVGCNIVCSICLEGDLVSDDGLAVYATSLEWCGHWFCNNCWRQFLMAQVKQGFTHPTCPEYACNSKVDKLTLMCMVPATVYKIHLRNVENSIISKQTEWQFCPRPDCIFLLSTIPNNAPSAVTAMVCQCGGVWCSECKEECHWPANCKEAADYKEQSKKKGYYFQNIQSVHVKKCPQCKRFIDKNGGCSHMICICGCYFCWNCLAELRNHREDRCTVRLPCEQVLLEDVMHLPQAALEYAILHKDRHTKEAIDRRKGEAHRLETAALRSLQRRKFGNSELASLCANLSIVDMEGSLNSIIHRRIRAIADEAGKFCGEAEYVLEFLEVMYGFEPLKSSRKGALSRRRVKLWSVSDKIHHILACQTVIDPVSAFTTLNHLLRSGKHMLRRLATALQKL